MQNIGGRYTNIRKRGYGSINQLERGTEESGGKKLINLINF
jgi:hypothetical protein